LEWEGEWEGDVEGEGLRAACTNISIAVNGVNNSAGQTLVWMWLRD